MTWIKTIPLTEADEALRRALEAQHDALSPRSTRPVHPTDDGSREHRGLAHA